MSLNATVNADPETATVLPPGHTVGESTMVWPWLALGSVLSILLVIARFARKRLPFGKQL